MSVSVHRSTEPHRPALANVIVPMYYSPVRRLSRPQAMRSTGTAREVRLLHAAFRAVAVPEGDKRNKSN